MKILVPVKRVVDANIKVKVGPDGKLDVANLKHSMNPVRQKLAQNRLFK